VSDQPDRRYSHHLGSITISIDINPFLFLLGLEAGTFAAIIVVVVVVALLIVLAAGMTLSHDLDEFNDFKDSL